jgi:hypothetical protein
MWTAKVGILCWILDAGCWILDAECWKNAENYLPAIVWKDQ